MTNTTTFTFRPVAPKFIEAMEAGLEHGRKRGRTGWDTHWQETNFLDIKNGLLDKLDEEYQELFEAISDGLSSNIILGEAADVANIVMMLADAISTSENLTTPSSDI